jgi:hypothetical protein
MLALVVIAGVKAFSGVDPSSAATTARGQTLFGMDVPSLDALDEAESATGIRPAIVGTFADWAHTPDSRANWRRRSTSAAPCR